jgi:Fe-Mn family superoxide dismutase
MFHRIPLPYALNHFEKILSSKLMDLHYNFHHKAYETALKIALENQNLNHIVDLEDLMSRYLSIFPSDLHSSIRFFGGGLLNHNIFFSILEKDKPLKEGALKSAIIKKFSSFEKFIDALLNAAVNLKIDNNVFGSG